MKFNYQESSLEEVARHLNTMERQSYHKVLKYYKEKDDFLMVQKLEKAKLLAKIIELQEEYNNK